MIQELLENRCIGIAQICVDYAINIADDIPNDERWCAISSSSQCKFYFNLMFCFKLLDLRWKWIYAYLPCLFSCLFFSRSNGEPNIVEKFVFIRSTFRRTEEESFGNVYSFHQKRWTR